jgi:predicted Zn-dependent protease
MTMSAWNPTPRHGRIRVRWIAALLIAAVGLITYFTNTQVNPVTGEKQHIAMTVDQEKALGLQAAPEMAQKMGGALDPDANPDAALVAEVGKRLVQQSDAAKSPYVGNFHYYLLNDPETINAFALPGGQVFITKALFDRLQDEAQLAGVLGHETGHVIARHSAEQMASGKLGQSLSTAVGVGASGDRHGQAAYLAAAMANQMLQLHYSRDDESEADTLGLKYMAQAGYDPREMLRVMEILKQASQKSGRPPEFLSTHPLPETRLERIKQEIHKSYPEGVPDTLSKGKGL